MQLFTGDTKVMEQEIEVCLDAVHRSKSVADSYGLFKTLEVFIGYYDFLTGNGRKYIRRLGKSRDFCNLELEKSNQLYNDFLENFISNKETHDEFIDEVFDSSEMISFESDEINEDFLLSEDEMSDMISDFFRKKYPDYFPIFQELVDSKRIHKINDCSSPYEGFTLTNTAMNTSHILLLDDQESSLRLLTTLSHELGHVIDRNQIASSMLSKDNHYYAVKSPFIEVVSSLYEKRFMDFLLEEKMKPKMISNMMNDFYQSLFEEINRVQVLTKMPDDLLRRNKYRDLSFGEFYDHIRGLIIDEDMELDDPFEYDLCENIRYGYGRLFATYFSALEKNNHQKFQEIYPRFLNLRTGYFQSDFFDRLGVSKDEIATVVNDEIASSPAKVFMKK